MRILLMDDEAAFARALQQSLREHHYEVDVAHDGETGLDMARTGTYDLLIVDVMMPKLSGYDVVRTLRQEKDSTAILLLTAKDGVESRVEGLDAGADDYLVKPFALPELLARVRALTRRSGAFMGAQSLQCGALCLDLVTRSITLFGEPLHLSGKEFQLMELFMRNPGRVLPKVLILERVWGYDTAADVNVVEIYVHMLRRKLAAHAQKLGRTAADGLPVIETVRGVGYMLKGA
ncbi:DNA-binding response regulator [Alicyclobacillus cellulosilyticus]|uniref:DNA-binding response regulator n=1 Tax=Alicyclobacillus cellulosilyticus TaxID=1003997 RepID=A0A917K763_9BACL|nr:response regulator transcription factor [Alicyclobacillus cellulosilyticus]GGJ00184.1 DNA-binding response regulator [Alicyclobacillus cellulosilyticus]